MPANLSILRLARKYLNLSRFGTIRCGFSFFQILILGRFILNLLIFIIVELRQFANLADVFFDITFFSEKLRGMIVPFEYTARQIYYSVLCKDLIKSIISCDTFIICLM